MNTCTCWTVLDQAKVLWNELNWSEPWSINAQKDLMLLVAFGTGPAFFLQDPCWIESWQSLQNSRDWRSASMWTARFGLSQKSVFIAVVQLHTRLTSQNFSQRQPETWLVPWSDRLSILEDLTSSRVMEVDTKKIWANAPERPVKVKEIVRKNDQMCICCICVLITIYCSIIYIHLHMVGSQCWSLCMGHFIRGDCKIL